MNPLPATVETADGEPVLVSGSLRIQAPDVMATALKPTQRVTIGVRPSDVGLGNGNTPGNGYDAAIEVVEYLGTEALLNVKVGGQEMVVQIPALARRRAKERSHRF
ncbi:TOBE domain-containing protein [Mesorhizobium sp. M0622]